jgi:hypothetical protein
MATPFHTPMSCTSFLEEGKNEKRIEEVWAPGLGAHSGGLIKGPPQSQGVQKSARENREWSSWCLKRRKEENQNKKPYWAWDGTFLEPKD